MKSKSSSICSWIDDLSEHEHLIVLAPVSAFLVGHGGTMMILVPELDDMESAAVDIEMDVALLEVTHLIFRRSCSRALRRSGHVG